MCLGDQSYQTVELLPEKFQNAWIFVLHLLCKMAGPMLKARVTWRTKSKKLGKLSGNITLVIADMVALYPNISHEDGLETLRDLLKVKILKTTC